MTEELRDVRLYGHLADRFGPRHRFAAHSVNEIVRAFHANYPDFLPVLKTGSYRIVHGECAESSAPLGVHSLGLLLDAAPIHFIPVAEGSDGKGILTAVLGLVIIASAFALAPIGAAGGIAAGMAESALALPLGLGALTYGQIAGFGAILALSGISQMLAPQPKVADYTRGEDKRQSHLFNGPVNRMEQGCALPVIYGVYEVGSIVVSAGITVNESDADDPPAKVFHHVTIVKLDDQGLCNPGEDDYEQGKVVTFGFGAGTGYKVSQVTLDDVPITLDFNEMSGWGYYNLTIDAPHTFKISTERVWLPT